MALSPSCPFFVSRSILKIGQVLSSALKDELDCTSSSGLKPEGMPSLSSIGTANHSGDSANTTATANVSETEAQTPNRTSDQTQANADFAAAMDAFDRRQSLRSLPRPTEFRTGEAVANRASTAISFAPDQPDDSGSMTLTNGTGETHN